MKPPPFPHTCDQDLAAMAAKNGLDVNVSMLPPLVTGPYVTDPFTCPHGTTYWIEPTGEQIAQWVKEGVK